jgi:hypothetical protein
MNLVIKPDGRIAPAKRNRLRRTVAMAFDTMASAISSVLEKNVSGRSEQGARDAQFDLENSAVRGE